MNVLVGPNGSGKTNVISFFDFLSKLPSAELVNAVSSAGGVGTLFRKRGEDAFANSLNFRVLGSVKANLKKYILYEYSATISVSEEAETVYYSNQRLKIRQRTIDTESPSEIPGVWDLDLEITINHTGEKQVKLHQFARATFKKNLSLYAGSTIVNASTEKLEELFKEIIEEDECIISGMRMIGETGWRIQSDFRTASYYNIIPSKVRQPEDGASEPYIRKDGSGLYATLFAIKRASRTNRLGSLRRRQMGPYYDPQKISLAKITEYARRANSGISSIDVENSPFDNQLQVKITINSGDESCVLPLSAMSDGTIKWITFVTILLARRSLFAVEEPENYLHPLIQSELITLMRNMGQENSQMLVSTHSETILNALHPTEIIIVSNDNGKTEARWPESADIIAEEIKRTGFGLGYYYISGGVE